MTGLEWENENYNGKNWELTNSEEMGNAYFSGQSSLVII